MRGEIWLEVLFVRGVNDDVKDLPGLIHWVRRVNPDRIQVNTVVRPPAEPWVSGVDRDKLEEIRSVLGREAEIVVPFRGEAERSLRKDLEERILEMVLRRPVAPEDLVDALGIGLGEASAILDRMAARHGWVKESYGEKTYLRSATSTEGSH
jgi:wyosine [tRNA(Phe)-imidazoG37] synthetase (radical SAM superfamily)